MRPRVPVASLHSDRLDEMVCLADTSNLSDNEPTTIEDLLLGEGLRIGFPCEALKVRPLKACISVNRLS